MLLKPGIQTIRVINMPTRHKHSLVTHIYILTAHSTSGRLHIPLGTFFAVFGLNLYNRQLFHALLFGSLIASISLGMLLWETSGCFEEITIRKEILLVIIHKLVWRETWKKCIHPKELMTWKEILEVSEYISKHIFYTIKVRGLAIKTSCHICQVNAIWTSSLPSPHKKDLGPLHST